MGNVLFLNKKFIMTVKYNQTNSYQAERQRGIVRVYLEIKRVRERVTSINRRDYGI